MAPPLLWMLGMTLGMTSPRAPSLVLRVGAQFSTAVRSDGERDVAFRIVRHGPVILAASQAEAARASGSAAARVMRAVAQQVAERAQLDVLRGSPCPVIGSAGIARAVITLGSSGRSRATVKEVHGATDTLAATWVERKTGDLPRRWAEPMMVGAAVLGAILDWLGASEIAAEAEPTLLGALEVG
jgi:hypothetical protein